MPLRPTLRQQTDDHPLRAIIMIRGYKIKDFFKIWCRMPIPHQDIGEVKLGKSYKPIALLIRSHRPPAQAKGRYSSPLGNPILKSRGAFRCSP
jgi:hypothetical protein